MPVHYWCVRVCVRVCIPGYIHVCIYVYTYKEFRSVPQTLSVNMGERQRTSKRAYEPGPRAQRHSLYLVLHRSLRAIVEQRAHDVTVPTSGRKVQARRIMLGSKLGQAWRGRQCIHTHITRLTYAYRTYGCTRHTAHIHVLHMRTHPNSLYTACKLR